MCDCLLTLIPLYPSLSPRPPATSTNAALRASFTPRASKLLNSSLPNLGRSPVGTWNTQHVSIDLVLRPRGPVAQAQTMFSYPDLATQAGICM